MTTTRGLLLGAPSTPVIVSLAVEVGACVRPVLQRLTDTTTGQTQVVAIPCGATLATTCLTCAERARKLRAQQCREGWRLTDDPIPDQDEAGADSAGDCQPGLDTGQNDEDSRRVRSTRRRQDAPDLPRHKIEARSLGQTYESPGARPTVRPRS